MKLKKSDSDPYQKLKNNNQNLMKMKLVNILSDDKNNNRDLSLNEIIKIKPSQLNDLIF